jgi:hypothetical protein
MLTRLHPYMRITRLLRGEITSIIKNLNIMQILHSSRKIKEGSMCKIILQTECESGKGHSG